MSEALHRKLANTQTSFDVHPQYITLKNLIWHRCTQYTTQSKNAQCWFCSPNPPSAPYHSDPAFQLFNLQASISQTQIKKRPWTVTEEKLKMLAPTHWSTSISKFASVGRRTGFTWRSSTNQKSVYSAFITGGRGMNFSSGMSSKRWYRVILG